MVTAMSDAHEAIRNLLGRYCELMDAGDFAGLAELFARASLAEEHGNVFATGAAEMRTMWERQTILYDVDGRAGHDGKPRTRHVTANPVITVDGDSATCTSSYVVFQGTEALQLQPIVTGRYADRFSCDDGGQWHFAQRRYAIDHVGDLSQHLRTS
jgi:3-phenylpropionate/cinnamic acid dioxygenase small subunit